MGANPSQEKLGTGHERSSGNHKNAGSASTLPTELAGSLGGNRGSTNYPSTTAPAPDKRSGGQEINSHLLRGHVRDDNGIDPGTVTSGNATPMGPAAATIVPVRD